MPQQNRVVERIDRMMMGKERSMLSGANLKQEFWVEVVDMACYMVNRSPSIALVNKIPYDTWDGKSPYLAHVRIFRCDAFVHVPNKKRSKMDNKSEKCIFISYKME